MMTWTDAITVPLHYLSCDTNIKGAAVINRDGGVKDKHIRRELNDVPSAKHSYRSFNTPFLL